MRDKLIELHKQAFENLLETGQDFSHENYADYLLANGVIVSTEDVVPRSEVEYRFELLEKNTKDRIKVEVFLAKQEIAREMFEEIDKILKTQEKYLYCNPSLAYVHELITELEKKYIGE